MMGQVLKDKRRHIIVAPHADDEIIGCYSILAAGQVHSIYYPKEEIMMEAKISMDLFDVPDIYTIFDKSAVYRAALEAMQIGGNIFFPDPIYEWHPDHRKWGNIGEQFLRKGVANVVFYSVNMTAPYIREVKYPSRKEDSLNKAYPSKKSLWKYDHKYFLFEGHCQWLTNDNLLCHD